MITNKQSNKLYKMMSKHDVYPKYDLALPAIQIKSKIKKRLEVGDVFLLALNKLELFLMDNNQYISKVNLEKIDKHYKLTLMKIDEDISISPDSKKYEHIVCVLDRIQSRTLAAGHVIELENLNIEFVDLYADEKIFAKAKLVTVDDEIALDITEVIDG